MDAPLFLTSEKKGGWVHQFGTALSNNPLHKGIPEIQTTNWQLIDRKGTGHNNKPWILELFQFWNLEKVAMEDPCFFGGLQRSKQTLEWHEPWVMLIGSGLGMLMAYEIIPI